MYVAKDQNFSKNYFYFFLVATRQRLANLERNMIRHPEHDMPNEKGYGHFNFFLNWKF